MTRIYGSLNEKPLPQAHGCEHYPHLVAPPGKVRGHLDGDPCWGSTPGRASSEGLWPSPTFSSLLSPVVFTPLSPLAPSSGSFPHLPAAMPSPPWWTFIHPDPEAKINYSLSWFSSGILAQQLLRALLCLRVLECCRAHSIPLRVEHSWDTVFGLCVPL